VAQGRAAGQLCPGVRRGVIFERDDTAGAACQQFSAAVAVDIGAADGRVVLYTVPVTGVVQDRAVERAAPGVAGRVAPVDVHAHAATRQQLGAAIAVDIGVLDGRVILLIAPAGTVAQGRAVGQLCPGVR